MGARALRRGSGGPVLRERVRARGGAAPRGAQAHQEAAAARAAAPQRVHAPQHRAAARRLSDHMNRNYIFIHIQSLYTIRLYVKPLNHCNETGVLYVAEQIRVANRN